VQATQNRSRVRRVPHLGAFVIALSAFTPVFAAAISCGEERFVSGKHTFPSHDEAMAQCREQEAAMTDAASGRYESSRTCHDEGEAGERGPWRYGRIGLDVVTRNGGDPYTFEALWMCRPAKEEPDENEDT
jgi:hypothetical protein